MRSSSQSTAQRFQAEALRRFASSCFCAVGMNGTDAACAARLLVRADLRGVETHGTSWLPRYCDLLREGRINPAPLIEIAGGPGAMAVVEGDGGLGHVVSHRAMEWCIQRAPEQGAAFAAVRNSRHNGAASLYALQAMEAGFIGFSTTGGGVRVAPAGGRESMLGTNPIAFAAPSETEPPLVIDMATSVVAGAKVAGMAQRGQPLPPGWALDESGEPTTDAEAADAGALLPLGSSLELSSHKGYALSLMVETLCNVFTGMATGPERARREFFEGTSPGGMGHWMGAMRIDLCGPAERFRQHMDTMLRLLRESEPQRGVERVLTPGEIEWRTEREREERGVPVPPETIVALNTLASELGVDALGSGQ